MKFILIFGPQAVGKMTVGQELEKITELKLFHNHVTIELLEPFLGFSKEMWRLSDSEQFKWLDEKIGGHVNGYTWHHTEIPGKMELVPTGIHNIITHNGGRTKGMWADAPR